MACIPKEEWMRIINEQESSELSISQYCSLHGISDRTFYNAKARYKKELENPTLVHVDVDDIISRILKIFGSNSMVLLSNLIHQHRTKISVVS